MVFLSRIPLLFLLIISFSSFSQNHFYNVDTIREIKLYFQQPDWDYILDSLYIEGNNSGEEDAVLDVQARTQCAVAVDRAAEHAGVEWDGADAARVATLRHAPDSQARVVARHRNVSGSA